MIRKRLTADQRGWSFQRFPQLQKVKVQIGKKRRARYRRKEEKLPCRDRNADQRQRGLAGVGKEIKVLNRQQGDADKGQITQQAEPCCARGARQFVDALLGPSDV